MPEPLPPPDADASGVLTQLRAALASMEASEERHGERAAALLRPVDVHAQSNSLQALTGLCPARHGAHGRVCGLATGHAGDLHCGYTAHGRPVAWLGDAPE
ncbi:hypothetical protein ACPCKW_23350 [Streptomyces griseoincarnatus]